MKSSALAPALVAFFGLASIAFADVNIVNETFDDYADQSAMDTVWVPYEPEGQTPQAGPYGILVPNTTFGIVPPNDDPPGIMGKAAVTDPNVFHINEYDDDNNPNTVPFELVPSATQAVRVSGDIFSDTVGNKRTSISLRNDTIQRALGVYGYNFIELGNWNAATDDPTVPGTVNDQAVTTFAYRLALFDSSSYGAPLVQGPNWQFFPLDIALDVKDSAGAENPDGLVTPTDIGVGWHRYTATITETEVTVELDLYRDGLQNSEPTEGVGTPGVDSSVTWTMSMADNDPGDGFDYDPFTSLRFGTPSGIGTGFNNLSVVDNISLDLIDLAATLEGDYDENGQVSQGDLDQVLLNWGGTTFPGNEAALPEGGPFDGNITQNELDGVLLNWGNVSLAATASVPEPSTFILIGCGLALMGARLRY